MKYLTLLLPLLLHGVAAQDDGSLDIQTQIYIVCGVYGGILLLLIILVLVLALTISRLKEQMSGDLDRYIPTNFGAIASQQQQIFAYENGAFNGIVQQQDTDRSNPGMRERSVDGDDLEGYTVYSGSNQNREEAYKVSEEISENNETIPLDNLRFASPGRTPNPVMKYEEGVVPLGEMTGRPRYN